MNNYIQGLKSSVLEAIVQAEMLMIDNDNISLEVVLPAAVSKGKAQRLLLGEVEAKSVTYGKQEP